MLRGAWQKVRHDPEIDRLERLSMTLADLDRAGELTIKYASGLCNHKLVDRAEELEAAVAEALKS